MAKRAVIKEARFLTGTQDSSSVSNTVKDIPIGHIQTKENVRKEDTDLEGLKATILEHGLIQPIAVYKEGDNQYIVKTGHRRFMAIQALHKDYPHKFGSIRCVITNANNIAVIQLIENVQRVDLSQIDLSILP